MPTKIGTVTDMMNVKTKDFNNKKWSIAEKINAINVAFAKFFSGMALSYARRTFLPFVKDIDIIEYPEDYIETKDIYYVGLTTHPIYNGNLHTSNVNNYDSINNLRRGFSSTELALYHDRVSANEVEVLPRIQVDKIKASATYYEGELPVSATEQDIWTQSNGNFAFATKSYSASEPAFLEIPSARRPDVALLFEALTIETSHITVEIVSGGAVGEVSYVRTGLGTLESPYKYVFTVYDNTNSNDNIIASLASLSENTIVPSGTASETSATEIIASSSAWNDSSFNLAGFVTGTQGNDAKGAIVNSQFSIGQGDYDAEVAFSGTPASGTYYMTTSDNMRYGFQPNFQNSNSTTTLVGAIKTEIGLEYIWEIVVISGFASDTLFLGATGVPTGFYARFWQAYPVGTGEAFYAPIDSGNYASMLWHGEAVVGNMIAGNIGDDAVGAIASSAFSGGVHSLVMELDTFNPVEDVELSAGDYYITTSIPFFDTSIPRITGGAMFHFFTMIGETIVNGNTEYVWKCTLLSLIRPTYNVYMESTESAFYMRFWGKDSQPPILTTDDVITATGASSFVAPLEAIGESALVNPHASCWQLFGLDLTYKAISALFNSTEDELPKQLHALLKNGDAIASLASSELMRDDKPQEAQAQLTYGMNVVDEVMYYDKKQKLPKRARVSSKYRGN